MLNITDDIRIK